MQDTSHSAHAKTMRVALAQLLQIEPMDRASMPATGNWDTTTSKRQRTGIDRLAWWLDDAIAVPGTRFRIGFDALIGLIPGIGDLVGTLLSSYIIAVAASRGLPPSALMRMAINVAIEAIVGLVPIFGDVFDAAWKANQRNIRLMQQFEEAPRPARRQSWAVVAAWSAPAIAFIVLLGLAAFAVIRWVAEALTGG